MSLLPLKTLIAIAEGTGLPVCQQFICNNPARLPTPAQWVTTERTRVKDSYTHVWWYGKTKRPDADNRRVLQPYSQRMKRLLDRGSYNGGRRPSGHDVGNASFLRDNGGAIPASALQM